MYGPPPPCCRHCGNPAGIYVTNDIVLASRPISPYFDNSCVFDKKHSARREKMFGGQSSKGQKAVAPDVQTDANAAKLAAVDVAGKHKHPNLHSGLGLIYFGPMTVNSRAHDVPMRDGECTGRGRA